MSPLTVTPLYAALLGLFYLYLSLRIPRLRMRHHIGLGDGNVPELRRAVRMHANFAEYVPLILVLLTFAELGGTSAWFLHVLGITLVIARLLHARGLWQSEGHSPGRFMGTVLTTAVLGISALMVLFHSLGRIF